MISSLFEVPQYSILDKESVVFPELRKLHEQHYELNIEYKRISDSLFKPNPSNQSELPYLPVSLFKQYDLKSISEKEVYKILTSSGTTGTVPSRIYLDKATANVQSLALSKIMQHVLGKERLPMLIIDSKSILRDRSSFSARGAGILGMSIFGKKHHYLLDDKFEINTSVLEDFISKFNGQQILLFGFTFMVWKYLYQSGLTKKLDLSNAILIHSGGWKKLTELEVSNDIFKSELESKFGLNRVYNFYGMVEQVGSVYLENEKGYLHCPSYSDIIIRNPRDLSVQPHGVPGLIQVLSILPSSYPGHSILTEDIGICMGENDLDWKGKYFKILGRAKKAELRGCSDVFASASN